jgi:hypothetical protein
MQLDPEAVAWLQALSTSRPSAYEPSLLGMTKRRQALMST